MAERTTTSPPPTSTSSISSQQMQAEPLQTSSRPQLARRDSHGAAVGTSSSFERSNSTSSPGARRQQPFLPRRRSSAVSDFSHSMADSTESLLLPNRAAGHTRGKRDDESSHWHSVPLAFAILPAIGGLFFKDGSSFITDVFLLGLGALFLNWFVRMPWYAQ